MWDLVGSKAIRPAVPATLLFWVTSFQAALCDSSSQDVGQRKSLSAGYREATISEGIWLVALEKASIARSRWELSGKVDCQNWLQNLGQEVRGRSSSQCSRKIFRWVRDIQMFENSNILYSVCGNDFTTFSTKFYMQKIGKIQDPWYSTQTPFFVNVSWLVHNCAMHVLWTHVL